MRTFTETELKEILCLHQKWLDGEDSGIRANMYHIDLYGANLANAYLFNANLANANLSDADLRGATLARAYLYHIDLSDANLANADLSNSILSNADLSESNLVGANLSNVDLSDADLSGANLANANLTGADLTDANLTGANLTDAVLVRNGLYNTIGNDKEIKTVCVFDEYNIAYTKNRLHIGCEGHSFQEWWDFTDRQILKMDGRTALSFWKQHKETIKNIVESDPAV